MTFNIYSLWIDPVFYISVAVFALFLFLLVYSVRKYMEVGQATSDRQQATDNAEQEEPVDIEVLQEQEMENSATAQQVDSMAGNSEQEIPVENLEQEPILNEVPAGEEAFEKTVIAQPSEMPVESAVVNEMSENMVEQAPVVEEVPVVEQTPVLQEQPSADLSEAAGFVKGIFNGISDIDERLKAVESTLSERKLNGDFALRYLEDILDEYESMDKTAVKSRIEYLIADLKK